MSRAVRLPEQVKCLHIFPSPLHDPLCSTAIQGEEKEIVSVLYTKNRHSMKHSDVKTKPQMLLFGLPQPMLILVRSEVCTDSHQLTYILKMKSFLNHILKT